MPASRPSTTSRRTRHLLVHTNDYVNAGDPLIDGPLVPQDILRVKGEEALYVYLLEEVQNVYRAQGVPINDKHIEIIVAQMLRKVRIENPGDTELLPNEVVDKFRFRAANEMAADSLKVKEPGDSGLPVGTMITRTEAKDINERLEADGKETGKTGKCRPANAKTLLLGITKASLQSESFLSGASFQETTKVLTEAALAGKIDPLEGLKENVLLGHLIPVGTGFKKYTGMKVVKLAEPPAQELPVSRGGTRRRHRRRRGRRCRHPRSDRDHRRRVTTSRPVARRRNRPAAAEQELIRPVIYHSSINKQTPAPCRGFSLYACDQHT